MANPQQDNDIKDAVGTAALEAAMRIVLRMGLGTGEASRDAVCQGLVRALVWQVMGSQADPDSIIASIRQDIEYMRNRALPDIVVKASVTTRQGLGDPPKLP
jgi:hypothetical protein